MSRFVEEHLDRTGRLLDRRYLVDGDEVSQKIFAVETAAETDRRDRLAAAAATLRSWAEDARATDVTRDNAVQVLDVVVDRLGVFFDRFADLLDDRPHGTG